MRLPHSTEAEASILGTVMLRGRGMLVELAPQVKVSDFFEPAHAVIWEAMLALLDRGEEIDPVAIETQLRRTGEHKLVGLELLNRIADRYMSFRAVAQHVRTVRDHATVRHFITTAQQIAEDGLTGRFESVAEYVDRSEQLLFDANPGDGEQSLRRIDSLVTESFKAMSRKGPSGLATGYYKLDEMTGGLQPTDLIVIAARPSMGKTAFAVNIAENVAIWRGDPEAKNKSTTPVLIFSLEMGARQLTDRIISSEARVPFEKVRARHLLEDEWGRWIQASGRVAVAPIYIDDAAAPTVLEIRARARRWRANPELFPRDQEDPQGLVVVDYLQLARGGKKKYGTREEEIADISRGLKAMAKELKLPVIALSQLNRAVDSRADHRPQLSDLRESGAIEQDADVIMFLFRAERYEHDEIKRRELDGKAEVILGKQRSGPTGTVELQFLKHITRFENPAPARHENSWHE